MLVHERLNNIGEPVFKNSYLQQMDPSFLSRISNILHHVESADYVKKVSFVIFLICGALLLTSVLGRLLETLRRVLMRRMLVPADEGADDIAFALDLAFGLANLTCTALLAWEVHDICTWILQTDLYENTS